MYARGLRRSRSPAGFFRRPSFQDMLETVKLTKRFNDHVAVDERVIDSQQEDRLLRVPVRRLELRLVLLSGFQEHFYPVFVD